MKRPTWLPRVTLSELYDTLVLASRSLTERRTRSLLTIIGIAIGPLALVSILSVVEGYSSFVLEQLEGLGQNLIILLPGADYTLDNDDLRFLERLDGVEVVAPYYSFRAEIRRGGDIVDVTVFMIDPDIFFRALSKLEVVEGDKPSRARYIEAVVGWYIAHDEEGRAVYRLNDIISIDYYEIEGLRVEKKRVNLLIRGVLGEFGNAFFVNPDTLVLLPMEAGEKLFGMKEWSGVMMVMEDPVYVENTTRYLRKIYQERVAVVSLVEISRVVSTITAAMRFVTIAAGGAAFVVAVTSIAATMITSVMERTREIGVLKAIGFTSRRIMAMILLESLIMGIIGSLIGMSIGVVAAEVLARQGMVIRGIQTIVIKASPAFEVSLFVKTLSLTLIVSIFGGLLPAYRASKIPPAEALRYE